MAAECPIGSIRRQRVHAFWVATFGAAVPQVGQYGSSGVISARIRSIWSAYS
jgi:hypothetical protein